MNRNFSIAGQGEKGSDATFPLLNLEGVNRTTFEGKFEWNDKMRF